MTSPSAPGSTSPLMTMLAAVVVVVVLFIVAGWLLGTVWALARLALLAAAVGGVVWAVRVMRA